MTPKKGPEKRIYLKRFLLQHFIDVIQTIQEDLDIEYDKEQIKEIFIRSDVVLFNQVIENLIKNY